LLELQKCFTCKNNRTNPLFSFCFINSFQPLEYKKFNRNYKIPYLHHSKNSTIQNSVTKNKTTQAK
jgi:hypothetical protein